MLFTILYVTAIVLFILCLIYILIYITCRNSSSHKNRDVSQPHKQGNLSNIIRWAYSGKHPQQKYYKNLFRISEDRLKELEIERIKKDGE